MTSHILKWMPSIALLVLAGAGSAFGQEKAPWGLPPGHSTIAPDVDHLYNVILWITGITFVGVQGTLLWFCIRYRRRPGGRPGYTHGNNTAEIIWTASPALVLVFIALYQFATWKRAKMDPPDLSRNDVVQIQVAARQFNWQFRYAGPNGTFGDEDDRQVSNNFWLPIGATAYMPMRSIDVIHSFFLFQMRVKQDVVPGLRNHVWFTPKGFYVAKIDKTAAPYRQDYRYDWRPKDTQKKWEGDYKFEFVGSEEEFQSKYGQYTVAIDNRFAYQDGLMRRTSDTMRVQAAIRNNEILEKVIWSDVDYCIVPFEGTCAELCGLQHFQMIFGLYVLPKKAYEWFLNGTLSEDLIPEQSSDELNFLWQNWRK